MYFAHLTASSSDSSDSSTSTCSPWSPKIPPALGNLVSCQYLYIYRVPRLSGTLPAQLGKLTAMRDMEIFGQGDSPPSMPSRLSGTIPSALGALTNMDYLYLYHHPYLSGSLPKAITSGSSLSLTELYLHGNSGLRANPYEYNMYTNTSTTNNGSSSVSSSGNVTSLNDRSSVPPSGAAQEVAVPPGTSIRYEWTQNETANRYCAALGLLSDPDASVRLPPSYGYYAWCICDRGFARRDISLQRPCECIPCGNNTYMDMGPSERFGTGSTLARNTNNDACAPCPPHSSFSGRGASSVSECECEIGHQREIGCKSCIRVIRAAMAGLKASDVSEGRVSAVKCAPPSSTTTAETMTTVPPLEQITVEAMYWRSTNDSITIREYVKEKRRARERESIAVHAVWPSTLNWSSLCQGRMPLCSVTCCYVGAV